MKEGATRPIEAMALQSSRSVVRLSHSTSVFYNLLFLLTLVLSCSSGLGKPTYSLPPPHTTLHYNSGLPVLHHTYNLRYHVYVESKAPVGVIYQTVKGLVSVFFHFILACRPGVSTGQQQHRIRFRKNFKH